MRAPESNGGAGGGGSVLHQILLRSRLTHRGDMKNTYRILIRMHERIIFGRLQRRWGVLLITVTVTNLRVNFLTDQGTVFDGVTYDTDGVDTVFTFLIKIEGATQNNKSTATYRFRLPLLHEVLIKPRRRT
jgi:hypothetical protein